MTFILFLLLIPVAEIAIFIQVGSRIGVGLTLLLVAASAVVGIWLVRRQGFAAATRVQAMMARGESPALGMLEGLALLAPRQAEYQDCKDQRVVGAEQPLQQHEQGYRQEIG